MNRLGLFCSIAILYLPSSPIFAGVDAEALVGERWYERKDPLGTSHGFQATEYSLGIDADPVPSVPVAFGLAYVGDEYKPADLGVDSASQYEVRENIVANATIAPQFTAYGRLGYVLYSEFRDKIDEVQSKARINGLHLAVGATWAPTPPLRVLAEAGLGVEMIRTTSVSSDGRDVSNFDRSAHGYNSKMVLIGAGIQL